MKLTMRVALVVEKCVELALLWKLATVESACSVGHRHERNGLAGSDGCHEHERQTRSRA